VLVIPSSSLQSSELQRSRRCMSLLGLRALSRASFLAPGIVVPYPSTLKLARLAQPLKNPNISSSLSSLRCFPEHATEAHQPRRLSKLGFRKVHPRHCNVVPGQFHPSK